MKLTGRGFRVTGYVAGTIMIVLVLGIIVLGSIFPQIDPFTSPVLYYLLGVLGTALAFGGLAFYCFYRSWQLLPEEEKQQRIEKSKEVKIQKPLFDAIIISGVLSGAILAALLLHDQLELWLSHSATEALIWALISTWHIVIFLMWIWILWQVFKWIVRTIKKRVS